MSATLRLWPRCTTSAPCDCSRRRIMLMAASWPSKSDAALMKRNGRCCACGAARVPRRWDGVLMPLDPSCRPVYSVVGFVLASLVAAAGAVNARRQGTRRPGTDERAWGMRPMSARVRRKREPRAQPLAESPWAPRPRQRELKRDAVILAAARAFRERGYHNTTLDDIAALLNVTKPTIYYYLANKEQIIYECFRAGIGQITAVFAELDSSSACGREKLAVLITRYAEVMA